jgi:excisionase family DNA binding protein
MSSSGDFATTEEAASILGVTVQHVRRLVDSGDLSRVARGLVDRASLDRYQAASKGHRTRVWAEHTAWGAIALLSGVHPSWLGSAQLSRLRGVLKSEIRVVGLVARTRDRAVVRTYQAHQAAVARLEHELVIVDYERLGLVGEVLYSGLRQMGPLPGDHRVDGYLTADRLNSAAQLLGLKEHANGNVTVRATDFDINIVRALASTEMPVLAALDAATSLDPRAQGVGLRTLDTALQAYRR